MEKEINDKKDNDILMSSDGEEEDLFKFDGANKFC